jgi:hypothetical protein
MRLYLKSVTVIITLIVSVILYTGCSKHNDTPPVKPVDPIQDEVAIVSLSINEGHYNETVVINGTGFNVINDNNEVFFNHKKANVIAATPTQLTVTVPLSAGTGTIKVVNGSKSATGPSFTYNYTLIKIVLAGSGAIGAANGNGVSASFNQPAGIAVNTSGDVFIADKGNHLIRKVTKDGIVSTFAGDGHAGSKDGTGSAASFNYPSAITIDKSGNLFVGEYYGYDVRKITPEGVVTTIAGSGIKGFVNGTGKMAQFDAISGITLNENGDIYVSDRFNNAIRKINTTGEVTTYKQTQGQTGLLTSIAADQTNNIYVTEFHGGFSSPFDGSAVYKIDASGTINNLDIAEANFSYAQISSIAINKKNDKYILYPGNQILKVTSGGIKSVMSVNSSKKAINSLKPQATALYDLAGITVDEQGICYIADVDKNQIIKIGLM